MLKTVLADAAAVFALSTPAALADDIMTYTSFGGSQINCQSQPFAPSCGLDEGAAALGAGSALLMPARYARCANDPCNNNQESDDMAEAMESGGAFY